MGRCANRIHHASFDLNGQTYHLNANNGENNLHSGYHPYSKRIWKVENHTETEIAFSLESPHMDQGFPGAVKFTVNYKLVNNELHLSFHGIPDQDTIINMTNHSYFNLNGHGNGNILNHTLKIHAESFTPADEASIPYGNIVPVASTPMDFTVTKTIGQDIDTPYEQLQFGLGYDHNYCISSYDETIQPAIELHSPTTGINMIIATDYPGIQMYTGNYLKGIQGKDTIIYHPRDAVCFEPQYYPDAINNPQFISPIQKANEAYHKEIHYVFQ